MKRGNIYLFCLVLLAVSFISAYSTNVNLNTFPDRGVQVYFIENTNQSIQLLGFLNLQSNSSGDLSFGYVGEENNFNVLITIQDQDRLLNYLLEVNPQKKELLEEYNFNLTSSNQINENRNNEFIFYFLNDFSENFSLENNFSDTLNESLISTNLNNSYSKYYYFFGAVLLLLLIFFFSKKSSSKHKNSKEEFDSFNPDKPVKLYQEENAIIQSARKKLKEVSKDVARLKSDQEKALKLRKEIIQRERELSKIKA
jgi:hypothetical protein